MPLRYTYGKIVDDVREQGLCYKGTEEQSPCSCCATTVRRRHCFVLLPRHHLFQQSSLTFPNLEPFDLEYQSSHFSGKVLGLFIVSFLSNTLTVSSVADILVIDFDDWLYTCSVSLTCPGKFLIFMFLDNGTGDQHAKKSESPEEYGKFGENRARYGQFDSILEKIKQRGMARQRPGSGNGASSEMMHLFEESHDTLLDGMDVKLKNAATYFEVDEEEINKEDYVFRYDANFPIDSKYDVKHANKSESPEEFGKFGENRARYGQFDPILEKMNQRRMARQRPGSGNGASSEMMHLFEESHDTLLDGMDVKLKNAATYFEVDEEEINKEDYVFRYDANFPIDSKYDVKHANKSESPEEFGKFGENRARYGQFDPILEKMKQRRMARQRPDGMDVKLKNAATYFEVDEEEINKEDYVFRYDANFPIDSKYDVKHANKSESPEEFGKFGENRARYGQFDPILEKMNQRRMARQRPGSRNGASSEMMHLFEESHDTLLDGMDEEINKEDYAFRYDANFPIDSKYDVKHANKSESPEEFGKFGENRARYGQFDPILEKMNQRRMARQRPGSGNGASSEMMHLFEESHDTLLDGMDHANKSESPEEFGKFGENRARYGQFDPILEKMKQRRMARRDLVQEMVLVPR
ncbi:unnamed protein product [Sphenostylis stenocarpa]|uniref:Uncharacterized protein n=1 Tax=Sphenostylis stenocarpa TaxID=92480 RepID=A0AA86VP19_9FABA|nr:unnamed protein product [Sphenostylis stenocarpa]